MASVDTWIAELAETHFHLQSRHGFGPPETSHDRAEAYIDWRRPDGFEVRLMFYGSDPIENLGMGIRPPDPEQGFGLRHWVRALDPELYARFHETPRALDRDGVAAWIEGHAAFFDAHLPTLLRHPNDVFDQVRRAEPLGEQCAAVVELCREVLRLEADHDFEAPQAVHWDYHCEISFAHGPLRLVIELEDHENAGVEAEPFTVPELYLVRQGAEDRTSLTELAATIDPDHAAARPTTDRPAVALAALRPWLEHDAAFLSRHPEVLG